MTMGLKKLGAAVAVTLFAIFAIWDTAHDFVANDTFCYFAHQPDRLLFVATIAIVGGFAALFFYWLSPRLQRRVKLLVLGLAASIVTLFGSYFLFWLFSLPSQYLSSVQSYEVIVVPLFLIGVGGSLWFEFYQVFKRRGHHAPRTV